MGFLLDTNVISELQRPHPSTAVLRWYGSVPAEELWTSALVVGELWKGVALLRRKSPDRAEPLAAWVTELVGLYGDRVLPVTAAIAEEWGPLNVPDPVPTIDGLLAATCRAHGLTLATRNVKDVGRTGVSWVNPFDA